MRISLLCLLATVLISTNATAQSCAANPVAVQILGSGGPAINRERASPSYLLWVGPQAKMLVDMGGGDHRTVSVLVLVLVTDDVQWSIVGDEALQGREAVLRV